MTVPSHSVPALRSEFGSAIGRHFVSSDQTVVFIERNRSHDVLAWLKDVPGQEFNYLTDVTAVDYRDPERPLEVVYQLRSLGRREDLRVKVALDKRGPLELRSVYDLWHGADWLEREVYDMFGVTFVGHPDLRRRVSAAKGLPAAGTLQSRRADQAGARGQPGSSLLVGRAFYRRRIRGAAQGHAGAARPW